jgi:hypothetical protein
MAVEIIRAKPVAPSKFLVIGEPFSGKTTLAAKAPKPVFISTDGNSAKQGLDTIRVKTVQDVRDAMQLVAGTKDYKTIVVDTVEGIVDIFGDQVLSEFSNYRTPEGKPIQALQDVPFGRATGVLNKRIQAFAEALMKLPHNVVVLSYTKRVQDDISGAIKLESEFKGIRLFTRFMDAQVLCYSDGEKHRVSLIEKREVMAGKVDYGEIGDFLTAIGWELPKKSTKVGTARKR